MTLADLSVCRSCGGGLRPEQRYCLQCGTRHGDPRVDPLVLLGDGAGDGPAAPATAPAGATPAAIAGTPSVARPSRRLTAGLAGATLLAGLLTGALLTPGTSPVSAATARGVLALVEDAPATADTTAASSDTSAPATTDDAASAPADATAGVVTDAAPAAADPVAEAPAATTTPTAADPTAGEEPTGAPTPAPVATTPTTTPVPTGLPAIKHVWLITLTGQTADTLFGPGAAATAPYVAGLLPSATLLRGYTPLTSADAAESIALLSGQAPTTQSAANCPVFSDVQPGTVDPATGLAAGDGCVYPAGVQTLPGQLTAAGRTWRAYVEGAPAPCTHPAPGEPDPTATPFAGEAARTARNLTVFFHGLIDTRACPAGEAGLDTLAKDLAAPDPATVPALSLVVPGPCHDGRELPCAPGAAAGVAAADAFLRTTVPTITASAAYRDGGLIAIVVAAPPGLATTGAAPAPGPAPAGTPAGTPATPPATGALLLSAAVRPGTVLETPTGPYALLRSLEDLFGLAHLGHAADPTVTAYDSAVYAATSAAAPTTTNPVTTTGSSPRWRSP